MESKSLSVPRSIGRSLNFSASTASAVANKLLEPHGLGLAQWAVLVALWRNGALSVKQISELTGNAPPAVSRIIDRMLQGGLVRRRPDENDRRAVVIDLSERGESLRKLENLYQDVNNILLADLSADDASRLYSILEQVNKTGQDWLTSGAPDRFE